jgi:hypothetical protein
LEATRIAEAEFKERVVANMIMLGAMAAYTGWFRLPALEDAVQNQIPASSLEVSKLPYAEDLRRGGRWDSRQNWGEVVFIGGEKDWENIRLGFG